MRYRHWGLIVSYVLLAVGYFVCVQKIPPADRMWHIGLTVASALDFLIVLLSKEETSALWEGLEAKSNHLRKEMEAKEISFNATKEDLETNRRELEEEIQKLKEEAQQRKVEKSQLDQKLQLIQSEIDLLTSQKDKFIKQAFDAKALCNETLLEKELLGENSERLSLENKQLIKKCDEINGLLQEKLALQSKWEQEAQVQAFHYKELEKEKGTLEEKFSALQNEISSSQKSLQQKDKELKEKHLQWMQTKTEFQELQEKVLSLQTLLKESEEKKTILTPEMQTEIEEKTRIERLYKQLRLQFAEKSSVLAQTRKELFHLQTELLANERDKIEEQLAIHVSLQDFEKAISHLVCQMEDLEQEIMSLEELVSRGHLQ